MMDTCNPSEHYYTLLTVQGSIGLPVYFLLALHVCLRGYNDAVGISDYRTHSVELSIGKNV
jgi:hypothetical protein